MRPASTLRTVLRAIGAYGLRGWVRFLVSVLLLLGASAASVLQPWPLKIVVDVVLGDEGVPPWIRTLLDAVGSPGEGSKTAILSLMCFAILAVHALVGGFRVLGDYVLAGAGERMVCRVRCDLFDFVQRQSPRFHQRRAAGDTLYRILTDAASFQDLFTYGLAPALTAFLTLAGITAVVLYRDPALTLALLLVALPLVALVGGLDRWVSRGSLRCSESESKASDHVQESLQGLQVLQAFGCEQEQSARFRMHARTIVKAHLKLQALESGSQAAIDLFLAGGVAVVVWMAGVRALDGRMTPGDVVLLVSYLWMLYEPIASLAYVGASVQESAAGVRRVFEVLDEPQEVADRPDAHPLPAVVTGRVSFRNVSYAYGSGPPVLRNLSLKVEAGTSVAVLGSSGAGKTTLVNLLLRFAEPSEGALYIDGNDLRFCTLSSLRASIAFVPQEPILFRGKVRDNLAIGKRDAPQHAIEWAAAAAGIHEYITTLPQGYDTLIGSGGVLLSAGQKQRIGIARAFLRDAPILLMDEPTSSLDLQTEAEVLVALRRLLRGRTAILISHRLAIARIADRVIILRSGAVAEDGAFETLLRRSKHLQHLHRISTGGPHGERPLEDDVARRLGFVRPAVRSTVPG